MWACCAQKKVKFVTTKPRFCDVDTKKIRDIEYIHAHM